MKNNIHKTMNLYNSTYVLYALLLISSSSFAQVGVGNTDPKASLDITASNQATPSNEDGILIPRVDNFPSPNPTALQNGMLIYLTTQVGTNAKGFYYWNAEIPVANSSWIRFSSIERLNDLSDGKSDVGGTQDGSSVFIGIDAGLNDDADNNQNVGVGYKALMTNETGDANSAFGFEALTLNTSLNNSAFGFRALAANSSGRRNSAFGRGALEANTTANFNTAMGTQAMATNRTGTNNVAIGEMALFTNDSGDNNTAVGYYALNLSTGNNNSAFGNNALSSTSSGKSNVAIGANAGSGNTTGDDNVLVGFNSGLSLTGGIKNVFIGKNTGRDASGSNNVFIGDNAGLDGSFDTVNSTLVIENSGNDTPLIYGVFDNFDAVDGNGILRVNGEFQVAEPGSTNGYAFPIADGTTDQILVTDGAGQLTFEDQAPDVSTFTIIRASISTDQTLVDTGWQKVAFNNVMLNPTSSTEFQTGNNRFVAATAGLYRVDASYHTTTAQDNTQYYGIAVYINGTLYQEFSVNHYYDGTNSSQVARQISCVANVTAGQTIEIYVNNNQSGVILDSFDGKTNFTIERIR